MKKTLKEQHSLFPIGLGAMPLSILGRPSEKESIKVIESFLQCGGNFIDTADVYGLDVVDRGHNEKLISKALRELNKNDVVMVATKGGATRPNGGWGLRGGHPKKIRIACEQSLINLNRLEHSLYYLHGPDPQVPFEDSLGELIQLKNEGKINNIGICNVTFVQLQLALNMTHISAVQNRCNPFCKDDFKNGLIEVCRINNIIYVPYSPLGGWADHTKLASSELFNDLISKYGVSAYVISLAWLLAKGGHIVPIPGMDKANQVRANRESVRLCLETDDVEKIDRFPDLYASIYLESS